MLVIVHVNPKQPHQVRQALEDLRAKRFVVQEKIERLGVDIQRNAEALADARERLGRAQKAQADLERLRAFSDVSQGDIDAAIEEARDAGRKRDVQGRFVARGQRGGSLRWEGRDGNVHFAKLVRHPGTKGYHFIHESMTAAEVFQRINDAKNRVIEKIGNKGA